MTLPTESAAQRLTPLIARAQAGDAAALEAVLVEAAPITLRFGRRVCGPGADAEDAAQDALISIAEHLGDYEGRAAFSTWVYAIVKSTCSRRRRRLEARSSVPLEDVGERSDGRSLPEADLAKHEAVSQLERALDRLDPADREVIALRDIEELSAEDAAQTLGISVGALKSRLHRARAALREALVPVEAPREASCPNVLHALSQKLEDELAPAACELLDAHVKTCLSCSSVCDTLRTALGLCKDLKTPGNPDQISALVRRALHRQTA